MIISDFEKQIGAETEYVLYRLPEQKHGHAFIIDEQTTKCFSSLTELNGKTGFVVAPFIIKEEEPIVLFQPEQEFELELSDAHEMLFRMPLQENLSANYESDFKCFIDAIKNNHFRKLVLSRSSILAGKYPLSPLKTFMLASAMYPKAMVYLCHSSKTGTWLGATPELLLSGNANQMHTVALAGTLPTKGDKMPALSEWSSKNREEQLMVADYVRNCIGSFGKLKDEFGPYSIRAGHLAHLKTDFYFYLDQDCMGDFLQQLHPTPAVCGLPKKEAVDFIASHESLNRSYYSGFLGWLDATKDSHLYVNLRCMRWNDKETELFAGGGILASSDLQSEWNETEEKIQTMKRLLCDLDSNKI